MQLSGHKLIIQQNFRIELEWRRFSNCRAINWCIYHIHINSYITQKGRLLLLQLQCTSIQGQTRQTDREHGKLSSKGNNKISYLPIKNDCKKVLFAFFYSSHDSESLTRRQTVGLENVFNTSSTEKIKGILILFVC